MDCLASEILVNKGFYAFCEKENLYPAYTHQLRISDSIWLLYDKNGFMTLKQPSIYPDGTRKKGPTGFEVVSFITLPKPIRTEVDLDLLLMAIVLNY